MKTDDETLDQLINAIQGQADLIDKMAIAIKQNRDAIVGLVNTVNGLVEEANNKGEKQ